MNISKHASKRSTRTFTLQSENAASDVEQLIVTTTPKIRRIVLRGPPTFLRSGRITKVQDVGQTGERRFLVRDEAIESFEPYAARHGVYMRFAGSTTHVNQFDRQIGAWVVSSPEPFSALIVFMGPPGTAPRVGDSYYFERLSRIVGPFNARSSTANIVFHGLAFE